MKIVIKGRGTGKTAELIRQSAETGIYILVSTEKRRLDIVRQAKEMGISNMPYPVTVEEILGKKLARSSIRRDGLLVNDFDVVLRTIFNGIDIKVASMSDENVQLEIG